MQTTDSAFSTKYKSASDALHQIIKDEGISGLYAGLPSGVLGVASTNFAYFYWYSFIRSSYMRFLTKKASASDAVMIGVGMELLLGAVAGGLAQIFTIPVSVVTTRQQTQVVHPVDDNFKHGEVGKKISRPLKRATIREIFMQIVNEEGITGLWTGLSPSLVLTVNPAITYGLFEWVKAALLRSRQSAPGAVAGIQLKPLEIFCLGVLSKTIATIVTYPYIMAKVRLQWKPADYAINDKVHYKSAVDILARILKSDGFAGWYKGMTAQIFKAVLSQALLFVIKDKLTLYTFLLFQILSSEKIKAKVQ